MEEQYYRKEKPRFKSWLNKTLRKRSVLIGLLLGLPLLSFMLFSNKGIIQRISLESEKKAADERLKSITTENQRLLKEMKALDNDPRAIERIAREKYGRIKQGETVYKLKRKEE